MNSRIEGIQLLRGVAVLSVLAFHLFPVFKYGYLGVDAFFVISGFSISYKYALGEPFKIYQYLNKRIRRLYPPLVLMIVVVSVFSLITLSPNVGALQNSIKTALAATFSASNIYLSRFTSGYFNTDSKLNPLLHTWSLSVEIQFYLLVIPLLFLVSRIGKRKSIVRTLFCLLILATWVPNLNFMGLNTYDISSGYFSTTLRIWEFLLGILIAYLATNNTYRQNAGSYITLMVVLFLSSIVFNDFNQTMTCYFTAILMLCFSLFPMYFNKKTFLSYIGDRSYSIYLWHWPIIVFVNELLISMLFAYRVFIIIVLVIFFSEIGFRLIENSKTNIYHIQLYIKTIMPFIIGALSFLIFSVYIGLNGFGFGWELQQHSALKKNCDIGLNQPVDENLRLCKSISPAFSGNLLNIGDSMAWASYDLWTMLATKHNLNSFLITRNGCAFSSDRTEYKNCNKWKKATIHKIYSLKIDVLVISNNISNQKQLNDVYMIIDKLPRSIKKIIIVLPPPMSDIWAEHKALIPKLIDNRRFFVKNTPVSLSLRNIPRVQILNLNRFFCTDDICRIRNNKTEFFNFGNHMSVDGNLYVFRKMELRNFRL